jgi:hypothetical protein
MKDCAHNNLLDAIRDRVPPGTNIANLLTDILYIGKEAAYRRLRGEVQFTLEEVATISKALEISVDKVIGQNEEYKSKPFQLKLTQYIDPCPIDYKQMEEYLSILNKSRDYPYREVGYATNIFPQTILFQFPYVTKFYMFRWSYQWHGENNIKSLDDIVITDKLNQVMKQYIEEATLIPNTYYIWDHQVFHYLINDIKCFYEVNFLNKDDVKALKSDIHNMIDRMEIIAARGKFDSGKKVQFYLCPINFETTYSYLLMENFHLSQIKTFTLNATVSLDKEVLTYLKRWIESLKRLSILISESGEIQRTQFFKDQRDLLEREL